MTIEVIDYLTKPLMRQGKRDKYLQGMSSLHTDWINNNSSNGYRVTFVDGIDDPTNSIRRVNERAQQNTDRLRIEQLNNQTNLSIPEMRELLRLSL